MAAALALLLAWLPGTAVAAEGPAALPEALRVRVLVPTVAGAEAGLQLLRAELAAGGFVVEERPAPGPGWVEHLRDAELFAAVVPDPGAERAAAIVVVFPVEAGPASRRRATDLGDLEAGPAARRHAIDLGEVGGLAEPARLRRLTALSVRVVEVLQAHARERAPATVATDGATTAAPEGSAAQGTRLRLHAGLAAGGAVTGEASAIGPWLGLSVGARRGLVARLSVVGPSYTPALAVAEGRVRVWGTLGLLEVGLAHASEGRISGLVALALGLQHALVRAQPAPGFTAADTQSFSPAAGVSLGLGLRLSPRLTAIAGLRIQRLFRRPEIWIDSTRVAGTPALLSAASVALELSL